MFHGMRDERHHKQPSTQPLLRNTDPRARRPVVFMADEAFARLFDLQKVPDNGGFGGFALRGRWGSIVVRDPEVLACMDLDHGWVGRPFRLRPYRRRNELHVVMAEPGYHATAVLTTNRQMFAYHAHNTRTVLGLDSGELVVLAEPTLGSRFRINGGVFRNEQVRAGGSKKNLIVTLPS